MVRGATIVFATARGPNAPDSRERFVAPPTGLPGRGILQSPESRPLRFLSEYLWPLAHFQEEKIHDTIVFFGSARVDEYGPLARDYREARELARLLTVWSESLSKPGSPRRCPRATASSSVQAVVRALWKPANRGASDAGGKTIGLNIGLPFEQRPNPYITPELSFEFHYSTASFGSPIWLRRWWSFREALARWTK